MTPERIKTFRNDVKHERGLSPTVANECLDEIDRLTLENERLQLCLVASKGAFAGMEADNARLREQLKKQTGWRPAITEG